MQTCEEAAALTVFQFVFCSVHIFVSPFFLVHHKSLWIFLSLTVIQLLNVLKNHSKKAKKLVVIF
jgi:hypothetical protein